jgi:hypothetical protein
MVTQSDYNDREIQACLSVMLELMTVLGEFRENIVLIGGNVPFMLIKNAKEKHSGSLDIDIALNFMQIGNETYKTILEMLKSRKYYQKADVHPFVFFRDITDSADNKLTVQVDLLAGEYGGIGKSHRHQRVQDIKARKARGCDLVFDNAVEVVISGKLPGGAENSLTMRVAAIGPFLVTKGMAIWESAKEKHAYDIYYCCKYYPGGPDMLVRDMGNVCENKLGKEGLEKIRSKFLKVNSIGPNWVADFKEIRDTEEREIIKREVFEIVNSILDKLNIKPYKE